jgi:hypothetical protein
MLATTFDDNTQDIATAKIALRDFSARFAKDTKFVKRICVIFFLNKNPALAIVFEIGLVFFALFGEYSSHESII